MNITDEEWSLRDYGRTWLVNNTQWGIHLPKNYEEDAKAISAVPEMISALLHARDHIISEYGRKNGKCPEVKPINKALKKAGVKL